MTDRLDLDAVREAVARDGDPITFIENIDVAGQDDTHQFSGIKPGQSAPAQYRGALPPDSPRPHVAAIEDHPARWTPAVLDTAWQIISAHHGSLAGMVDCYDILDPFAGTGGIHQLQQHASNIRTWGIELEPEWAACHQDTEVGDATDLPYDDYAFDCVCTSPSYGNRMADNYDGRDGSRRRSYRLSLRRPLTSGSGSAMHWSNGKRGDAYRLMHVKALIEMRRVLREDGLLIVNMSDHIRDGRVMKVVDWWEAAIRKLGFVVLDRVKVDTPRMRMGDTGHLRVDGEELIVAVKP